MQVVARIMPFAGGGPGSFRVGGGLVSFLGIRGGGSGGFVWHIASAPHFL